MNNPSEIVRDSFEPAYSQLSNILLSQISAGDFRTGTKLPSEAKLCKRYDVSSMTVRRSINILLDKGVVHTIRGKGTFVRSLKIDEITFGIKEFTNLFKENVSVSILEARIISATKRIERELGIKVGSKAISIKRLLSNESGPLIYHQEYLIYDPYRPIVETEMEIVSLKGLFTGDENTSLKGGQLAIEVTTLTDKESQLLQGDVGEPAFRLEHTFKDFDDMPVIWGWFICRGKHLRFKTKVGVL
jgi:DNA-binding GntR family transcriptional regulator